VPDTFAVAGVASALLKLKGFSGAKEVVVGATSLLLKLTVPAVAGTVASVLLPKLKLLAVDRASVESLLPKLKALDALGGTPVLGALLVAPLNEKALLAEGAADPPNEKVDEAAGASAGLGLLNAKEGGVDLGMTSPVVDFPANANSDEPEVAAFSTLPGVTDGLADSVDDLPNVKGAALAFPAPKLKPLVLGGDTVFELSDESLPKANRGVGEVILGSSDVNVTPPLVVAEGTLSFG